MLKTTEDMIKIDQRFNKIFYDPKFVSIPKKVSKVKIDDRFAQMFVDERFNLVTKTDKYGRKLKAE